MVDFILQNYVGIVVFLLAVAGFVFYFLILPRLKKGKKSLVPTPNNDSDTKLEVKEEEVVKEVDLVEIKEFDDDEYVSDVFNSVFYSMQCDNWDKEVVYDKITFTKRKQTDRYNNKSISVEFEYRFDSDKDYKKKIFNIKEAKLRDGSYSSFYFKGNLPIEVKKFLYSVYSDWINEKNSKEKEKVDKSLENIREVLGKASERGAKLDELLGN